MIVVGTAGHIDHGKSAIVKRLTGTDPDRLPEEQARGMTIDLGFAFYRTDKDETIALVDVPGHERFVKNMIAGVGGIDAVILVIAADDGWMPQSEEHFQIIRLLGVRYGFIVINKIDLVEPEWVELLEDEIRTKVAGTFLAESPMFPVSATTGAGFDRLSAHLSGMPAVVEARKDYGKARLYMDRSFIRPGIGGVVTGTLRGGTLKVGQTVSVWPSCVTGKIRTLQSNNRDVDLAQPGQRTAVSFTGVDREHLQRGGVVVDRLDIKTRESHPVLALSLEMLSNSPVELADRRRALVILGTTEVEGEIRLYEQKTIGPSGSGIVFFKPDSPVYSLAGDHYILRLPTPMVTLGGGHVLDHLPHFPRRKKFDHYEHLKERLRPDIRSMLISELRNRILVPESELLRDADFGLKEAQKTARELETAGEVGRFGDRIYHVETLKRHTAAIHDAMSAYLRENPHLKGLTRDAVRGLIRYDRDLLVRLLDYMVTEGTVARTADVYNLAGRGTSLKGVIKEAHDRIIRDLTDHPEDPPSLSKLASEGKVAQQAIKYILESGEGYKCGSDFLFLAETWRAIVSYIKEQLSAQEKLMVADLRTRFGFSRKYAIPILEETDRIGLTRRDGDARVRGEDFESEKFIL
ncbi:MAG: selenocysteine-specific translation elongation factor [candidate division Zixibacteria bacterium]|nr:selenocysteine-specific translation elongation factor [candidate division Zixibacteria bacterium]